MRAAGPLSVVVTAKEFAATIADALVSVFAAVDHLERSHGVTGVDIVVVDDGSTDGTADVARALAEGNPAVRVVGRDDAMSNAAAARNHGTALTTGDAVAFLDGDDRWLPPHLSVVWDAIRRPGIGYVKTAVVLPDWVHSTWHDVIAYRGLASNLGVRRSVLERVGGFPDVAVQRRAPDGTTSRALDLFAMREDTYLQRLVEAVTGGVLARETTCVHTHRPGNALDRQRDRFQAPAVVPRVESDPVAGLEARLREIVLGEMVRRARLTGPSPA